MCMYLFSVRSVNGRTAAAHPSAQDNYRQDLRQLQIYHSPSLQHLCFQLSQTTNKQTNKQTNSRQVAALKMSQKEHFDEFCKRCENIRSSL